MLAVTGTFSLDSGVGLFMQDLCKWLNMMVKRKDGHVALVDIKNYLIYIVCFECVLDLQVANVVAAMSLDILP